MSERDAAAPGSGGAERPGRRYEMLDLDIGEPLKDIHLGSGTAGVAVLLRRNAVPVTFWMEEVAGRDTLTAGDLERRIAKNGAVRVLAAAIEDELGSEPPAATGPTLTVAICTRNRPDGVARLLDSIRVARAACPAMAQGVDVLVVDNAPPNDATQKLCASRPETLRYVVEARQGLNFGRNRAVREARGQYLAFVDDDVVVDRLWLEGFLAAWATHPDAAAFTGQVLPLELETEAQILFEARGGFRRGFERVRFGAELPGNPLYPGGSGMLGAGANMTYDVEFLRRVGGFDEALDTGAAMPGGGDLDMFYRVIRAGRALVYEPRFLVFHQHRREMAALRRQYGRSWGMGFMAYVVKCFRTDPDRRRNLVRLVGWWFAHELWQLQKAVRGVHALPPSMILGELAGGVVGLFGGYGRSLRRVERIRRLSP